MRSMVLEEPGQLRLATVAEAAAPGPYEALVRVHRVGVCGTDYHAFRGRQPFFSYPRILGHELGVEVVDVGSGVEHVRPGDRCAVEPYLNCGQCIACRWGKGNCCVNLKVLGVHVDGGMREQMVVPAHKLHPSPTLSFDQLALVEPLCIGAHAVSRAQPVAGEWVLVIGAGPIGLGVMQSLRPLGCQVIALDLDEQRLSFCRAYLGVHTTLRAGADALEQVRNLTDGDLPTVVFDATGNADSMQRAFNYVAPGGRLVFVGLFSGDVTFHDPDFHRRETTLLASRNALGSDFQRIIQLIETGAIDTVPWLTHSAKLDELDARFTQWLEPSSGVIKAMIEL